MNLNPMSVRGGYIGTITKLEKFVESCSDGEFIATTLHALQKQLSKLQSAREKYIEVQRQIIDQQPTESKKQHEQEAYENILAKCSAIETRLSELMDEVPEDTINTSLDEMRDFMRTSMEEQEKKHQEQLTHLLEQLNSTLKSQVVEKPTVSTQEQLPSELANIVKTIADTTVKQSALIEKLTTSSPSSANTNTKLPQMSLPKFSGKFSEWIEFRDNFESSIINHAGLSPVQKFQYLKNSLTDSARSEIKHLPITNANFEIAWDALKERFEKPYNIIMDHIQQFKSLPCTSSTNIEQLSQLCNTASESVSAVRALGVESFDLWLIHDILLKLDDELKMLWSEECDKELPDWNKFIKFLFKRRDNLVSSGIKNVPASFKTNKSGPNRNNTKKSPTALVAANAQTCKCCNLAAHPLFKCSKFLSQSPDERFQLVKQLGLCRNCITANHNTAQCTYYPCRKCNARHNILLHEKFSSNINSQAPSDNHSLTVAPPTGNSRPNLNSFLDSLPGPSSINISQANVTAVKSPKVFLATAMVDIVNSQGRKISCRAILDSGSQRNIMSTALQRQLCLPSRHATYSMQGIGGAQSSIHSVTEATLHSKTSPHFYNMEFLVIPKITGDLPNWPASPKLLSIPPGVQLADPEWFVQKPVDILIGGDTYWDIVLDGNIHLGDGLPKLKPTTLGYIIVGCLNPVPQVLCNLSAVETLDQTLSRFWEVEDIPDDPPITDEQRAAELHFSSTYKRSSEGRFVVQLPFRKDSEGHMPTLGSSRSTAVRQLLALERRFEKNPAMKALYIEVMRDYLARGWLEPVPRDQLGNYSYYMPHHGVLKDSTTTRLRIVYNASSRTSNGLSLNDILLAGPTVHPDLFTVLLRFRKFEYAITADISKMYLQLVLYPEHADFQRLVFRENVTEPIKDYRIPRVCFGVKSSPFLATRALVQLADDHQVSHPLASAIIKNCFYVDDCIYSSESLAEAKEIQSQLVEVLDQAGFVLAKWNSNSPHFEPSSLLDSEQIIFHSHDATKTLGIQWNARSDVFQFVSPISSVPVIDTKRGIASAVAKIFDPLERISPVVIIAKILLQDLHRAKIGWDSEIPSEHLQKWKYFVQQLQSVQDIEIPRWIMQKSMLSQVELHGFCDSSTKAYGAAIYFIGRDELGKGTSVLIVAKSRVAPIETQTIPRLELCGAVLVAELMLKIKDIFLPDKMYFWTDSTIVLGWINSPPDAYKVFVAKRVRRILKITKPEQWNHVPTNLNPADLISRGSYPAQLAALSLWWNGPPYLLGCQSAWPINPTSSLAPEPEDSKQISLPIEIIEDSFFPGWIQTVSSLRKLQFRMAYILRFIHNLKNPKNWKRGPVSVEELESALRKLIFLDQFHHFPEVMRSLQRGRQIPAPWKFLNSLSPFLDTEGILRVGGRLQRSEESFAVKHPILLPKTKLQELIGAREHNLQLHAAPSLLLASLRQKYWPISGRNLSRKIVRQCVTCIRARPRPLEQMMGSLPPHRVTYQRPFHATAVDYAGPLLYKTSNLRTAKTAKAYICLFVCLSVKAIHLELVSDLTTDAFLAAFRRFVGRRSAPRHLYSDCGTNFVGAHRELAKIYKDRSHLASVTADLGVIWHFNPPGAPHQGGLWEAGVKGVKFHLGRVLGHSPRTFEEVMTILCQIEGLLNSRPLCALSEDPADSDFLTPGHFLVGGPLNSLPDPSVLHVPENRLSRWQACQKRAQEFAERWRREYLNTLNQRTKWKFPCPNLEVGDIVITLDDAASSWILGKIENVHPGLDGLVRVVSVRTSKGTYKRPITKLAKIPIGEAAGLPSSPGEDVPAMSSAGKWRAPNNVAQLSALLELRNSSHCPKSPP
ncbi:uncharacterized protein LOC129809178 [Phlebotomus papatasi]|uniref:uncharacterized protein LOC129809178 n=1 Tax=Phlebotomus papatasi TaxID=29031 RepID=UPI002483AB78|nr:uncharacterized protein LOC129809178 [Phlebotomus papatasi]XP_055714966.1 uncharacterized protein LOC129809178 [Phlebotomus papatasi]XP_055714967.1 uncharacterized protein LOC129809178 [Phlebotomus papatasi]XP_055714968.1 uncharacterized protein LOC129809178 [Phlebotomus papatasi]XP_055714969.1 uncharacterized protein LOC129809178 [Phlebotomus papatasi]